MRFRRIAQKLKIILIYNPHPYLLFGHCNRKHRSFLRARIKVKVYLKLNQSGVCLYKTIHLPKVTRHR